MMRKAEHHALHSRLSKCDREIMTVIWELDFYSRPLVDENNKKVWEVLVCESPLTVDTDPETAFRFTRYCPNSEVNSVWLRTAVEEAIAEAPKRPDKIRFFRRQMANMIIKGCEEAGVPAYASRRTMALHQWIQQRLETVYPALPNYKPSSNPSVNLGDSSPQPLPDALIGQQWAFVTLEASTFADLPDWEIGFGEVFPLALADLPPATRIPGLLMFSPRALPMAAWMSGLEMAYLRVNREPRPQLLLETGASESWVLANLSQPELLSEADGFDLTKRQANGVHFVAVQSDPEADSFAGFWMMQELSLA